MSEGKTPHKSNIREPEDILRDSNLEALMDKRAGLTIPALLDKLDKMQNAKQTVFAKFEGRITDRVDVDDNSTQAWAWEQAAKIRRMYPDPKLDVNFKRPLQIEVVDRFTTNEDAPQLSAEEVSEASLRGKGRRT